MQEQAASERCQTTNMQTETIKLVRPLQVPSAPNAYYRMEGSGIAMFKLGHAQKALHAAKQMHQDMPTSLVYPCRCPTMSYGLVSL